MTIHDYYLRAARLQRMCDRMQHRYTIRLEIAARHARCVSDRTSLQRYQAMNARAASTLARVSTLILLATVARNDARDRMYFDPWEEQQAQAFAERVRAIVRRSES